MRVITWIAAASLCCLATPAAAKDAELFILGALHGLHEDEESFGYDDLDRVITVIKPDVVLLEVTPEELAGKLETKGRPEYPKVIWPLLNGRQLRAYPMEPSQPFYGELTGDAGKRFTQFKQRFPAEEASLAAYSKANSQVLLAHWKSVADTQDDATDALGKARADLTAALVPGSGVVQSRWDGVMVEVARRAVAENPGKRILLLGSYRNRYMFVEQLRGTKGVQAVDMKNWLQSKGFGRPVSTAP